METQTQTQQQQYPQTTTQTNRTAAGGRGASPGRASLQGSGYAAGAAMLSPRGAGEPAAVTELKARFSALLGQDLSGIRIRLNSAGDAAGVAQGGEIRLGLGAEDLRTREGSLVLAHELIHACQETRQEGDGADVDACETEADVLAQQLVDGRPVTVRQGKSAGAPMFKGLLTWSRTQRAIRYNRRRGYSKARIRRYQNIIGTLDDGIIGPRTCRRIARYQLIHGLSVDGMIGPKTRRSLDGQHGGKQPGPGTTPTPGPPLKNGQLSAHFQLSEFRSKDGAATPKWVVPNLKKLAANLEVLRAAFGGAPISINSGYRSPSHNANVGGAKNSQHMKGTAADLRVGGRSTWQVKQKIESLIKQGKMKQGGLGRYSSFVHYDIRGSYARW